MVRIAEIGGYLELERFRGELYHGDAIPLNSARGCLAYLAELRGIGTMWIPDFMCGCVPEYLERIGVAVRTFPVGVDLLPDYRSFEVGEGEWLLLADYYGQLWDRDVREALSASGGRLIIDETQGFFREPWEGADTVYTCRKWFGVADGAYLSTKDGRRLDRELPRDESHARMGFVLGRFERPASEFYAEASANNDAFADESAKLMSPITENILRAVDYEWAKARRDDNWDVLDASFSSINAIHLRKPDGAFMYPLMVDGAQAIRRRLSSQGVYVPCLWPDVSGSGGSSLPAMLAAGIMPLPLDQRYGRGEIEEMASIVMDEVKRSKRHE